MYLEENRDGALELGKIFELSYIIEAFRDSGKFQALLILYMKALLDKEKFCTRNAKTSFATATNNHFAVTSALSDT